MRTKFLIGFVIAAFVVVGCADNDREEITDQTGEVQEFPQATGEWREARVYRMTDDTNDDQECHQVDFRVNTAGGYSLSECSDSKTGQLTADEFLRLDSRITNAYQNTESMVCPEIFKFGEFYAAIDSGNDELDRNFDPDSSCYGGSESAVSSYRQYMVQLLRKYQGVSSSR